MLTISKKRLVIAVAVGMTSFGTFTAQAEDFGASSTLINTLAVTNINDLDIGSVFASTTGTALANGVAALVIGADGTITEPTDSDEINMISLSAAVPAQASVDSTAEFNLILPDTSTILASSFEDDTGTTLVNITNGNGNAVELVHDSANPDVPSLWLMHFTVADVSGGVAAAPAGATANDGDFAVAPEFGQSTYVFTIGATVTTQPSTTGQLVYQEGTYAGTFAVTASY